MNTLKFSTNRPPADPAPSDTIDVLILRCLKLGGIWTAKDIAKTWGEDETRVREWLSKFVKNGICVIRPINGGRSVGFHGDPHSIDLYIAGKKWKAG